MQEEHIHLIGVGGIGMSAIARILAQRGVKVSGSDAAQSTLLEQLAREGVDVRIGHNAAHVEMATKVVYSSAVKEDNPEYAQSITARIPLIHRSSMLHELMVSQYPLLVSGTHGKTTTSSLLAHTLFYSKEAPSFAIGGIVQSLKSNAGHGSGKWFVAEADESDGSFLAYDPYGAILTNIGLDHLDHWATEENLIRGFTQFAGKVANKDCLFWCADDLRLSSILKEGCSYGFSSNADLRIENPRYLGWKSLFNLAWRGCSYQDVEIPLIGKHNILNAAAVFGLCLQLGLSEERIRESFALFSGVGRRVEKKGEHSGIAIYDDYGHHPTEIAATLQALRFACPEKRIVVCFQPHRYSRTKDCFEGFGPALGSADVLFLTDIYSAGENPIEGIDSSFLSQKITTQISKQCHYVPKSELISRLVEMIQPGDVVVTMGAGDITRFGPMLLQKLQEACH